jgi:hypothetical protein
MQFRTISNRERRLAGPAAYHWGRAIAGLAVALALSAAAQNIPQGRSHAGNPAYLASQANRLPDANDRMEMRDQQEAQQNFENANEQRRKLLAAESAQLLELAADLKKVMDKTDKNTLSLEVIRKADEIEKLARDVKAKMKLTVGQG